MSEKTVELPDGRHLSLIDRGPLHAPVVVHHHAAHSSRYERPPDAMVTRLGIRLITIDRPGHGNSHPVGERAVAAWAYDLNHVLDDLHIPHCAVTGWGHGNAYALAAVAALQGRVVRAELVSPIAPPEAQAAPAGGLGARLWRSAVTALPTLLSPALALEDRMYLEQTEKVLDRFVADLPAHERQLFDDVRIQEGLMSMWREGHAQGGDAARDELTAVEAPWGFDLMHCTQPVGIWAGEADTTAPVSGAAWLAEHLPDAMIRTFPKEGHGMLWRRWESVLARGAGRA